MKNFFWGFIFYFLWITGIYYLVNFFMRKKVRILCYHNPELTTFHSHLAWMKIKYNVISLDYFVSLASSSLDDSNHRLPDYPLIITIDDGHAGNYELKNILASYGLPFTIYLTSSPVISGSPFWWKLCKTRDEVERLKELPNINRVSIINQISNINSLNNVFPDALTVEQIYDFLEITNIDIGSHSVTHPILTKCSNHELAFELEFSKNELSRIFSRDVKHFCYPNGNWNDAVIDAARASGYKSARTTQLGLNDLNSDLFKLKIVGASDFGSLERFKLDLIGLPLLLIFLLAPIKSFVQKFRASI